MHRNSSLVLAFSLALVCAVSALAQDSPSLGDLARQAQKDKEKDKANKPAAKVFTNEDMPSGAGVAGAALGGGTGPASTGRAGANPSPAEQLDQLEGVVSRVESLDKATIVRNVLGDKSDVNFPGRAAWEQRLMSSKDAYVTQARGVLQKARQIIASADGLKGTQDPNDPRVKDINAKLQLLIRDAVQTDAGLQAVIMEGRDLASQPSAH